MTIQKSTDKKIGCSQYVRQPIYVLKFKIIGIGTSHNTRYKRFGHLS